MSESHSTCAVEYRPIPGFPGYRAGSDGSIWSCWKADRRKVGKQFDWIQSNDWKQMKPWISGPGYKRGQGYLQVYFRRGPRVRAKVMAAHRAVLMAFVGPCPEGHEARHHNGVRTDNRISNLSWATHVENCKDRDIHGTHLKGARVKNSILNEDDVREIRRRSAAGETHVALGKEFGVTDSNIYAIVKRRNWKHVA